MLFDLKRLIVNKRNIIIVLKVVNFYFKEGTEVHDTSCYNMNLPSSYRNQKNMRK
jgi:hypothetical protein